MDIHWNILEYCIFGICGKYGNGNGTGGLYEIVGECIGGLVDNANTNTTDNTIDTTTPAS